MRAWDFLIEKFEVKMQEQVKNLEIVGFFCGGAILTKT
jgi:hypothetical protein